MGFLVDMTTEVPEGTTPAEVADMRAREAAHTRDWVVSVRQNEASPIGGSGSCRRWK
jgi:muconolactone delta-isomerase